MCRHLAYLGPPVPLAALLLEPPHALLRQSWAPRDMRGGGTVNADGFGVGWYPEPGGRRRSATAAPCRSGRTRRSPRWPRPPAPAACWPRCARPPSGMPVTETAARAVRRRAAGCSATTAWSRGWPDSVAALAAALPVTDLLTLDAPHRRGAAVGAGAAPAARRRRPGRRAGRRRRRGRRRRPGLPAQPAAHRRHRRSGPPPGTTRCRCAPTTDAALVASEPLDDDPGWTDGARPAPRGRPARAAADRPRSRPTEREPDDQPDRSTSTSPSADAEAALRADARAGLTATPKCAAAEVVLRRPRQRAVRADHRAARVLPDPRRAGASSPSARRRDRRGHRRATRWSSWAPGSSEKTRLLLDAFAPGRHAAPLRAAGRQRVGAAAGAWTRSAADYPELRVHGVVGDFTRHLGRLPGRRPPAGRLPRRHDRQPAARPSGPRSCAALRAVLRAGRAAAARHRPGEVDPRVAGAGLRRRGRASPPSSTATCCACSTASWAPTSTSTRSTTSRCGTPSSEWIEMRLRRRAGDDGCASPALDLTVRLRRGRGDAHRDLGEVPAATAVRAMLAAAGFALDPDVDRPGRPLRPHPGHRRLSARRAERGSALDRRNPAWPRCCAGTGGCSRAHVQTVRPTLDRRPTTVSRACAGVAGYRPLSSAASASFLNARTFCSDSASTTSATER